MSADLARPVALRPDARLVPAARLPARVRAAAGARRGEHALVAGRARAGSTLVDAATARLLRRFARPRRVADVLLEVARERGAAPDDVLDAAFPVLERLARAGWLVGRDGGAPAPAATLAVGDRVGRWAVADVLRVVEDTEVYQARDARGRAAALKLVRAPAGGWLDGAVRREARALRRLGGLGAPALLRVGAHRGADLLLSEWREGAPAARAAAELRALDDGGRALLALARAVAGAYARLHAAGVLHGDVHPGNVLVARDGEVTLLDFGHALVDGDAAPPRVAVAEYRDPELADALRRGLAPPPLAPAGEQHAVAALLYELVAGRRWGDFSLVRDTLLRQIVEDSPLPFADAGAAPWPSVERVLRRGLAKRPADRFPTVAALAGALAAAAPRPRPARPAREGREGRPAAAGADSARRRAFVDAVLDRARPGGPWEQGWPRGLPRVSARDGAAGVAWALHRAAAARGDARWLAWADAWAARAADVARRRPGAFFARAGSLARARLGEASYFHAAPGVHVARALVARARGDDAGLAAAVAAFVASPLDSPHAADYAFGAPGLLGGAAVLRDAAACLGPAALAPLEAAGDRLADVVLGAVRAGRPGASGRDAPGAAHGAAGAVRALLEWRGGRARLAALRAPLERLARLGVPAGRGLQWPWEVRAHAPGERPAFVGGWCNGSAGYVHLWLAADARLGGPRWLDLAARAGWHAWEAPPGGPTLCCGDAGRGYALLALHRRTGDGAWLRRATSLADRAMAAAGDPAAATPGLYQGTLGVAALLADLERPEAARMPLVEREGWCE